MRIEIPEFCLVALVGASGSGKSTFAETHFKPTEVLSSYRFRALVSDDESDQSATEAAFDSLFYIANKRLDAGRLTVIDATNVQKSARAKILQLSRAQNCLAAAIVFDMPEKLCIERNNARPDRTFGPHVVRNHCRELRRDIRGLKREGFRYVYVLKSPEEAEASEIVRNKLWNDRRTETGPFDIIGDVHGCYDELCALLEKIGYEVDRSAYRAAPPENRRALFLGDLCDRGPKNADVLRLVITMVQEGSALCVPGNHDVKLLKYLRGSDVKLAHGLAATAAELAAETAEFRASVAEFIDNLVSHYVFDGGRLVTAHAGLPENLHGRSSGRVREFCLYGDTTGETDDFGLPVRQNWAEDYRGSALVVYGHTPSIEVIEENNTLCIDTGCVFGGKLTAYRYPERECVDVSAARVYYESVKPLDADKGIINGNGDGTDAGEGGIATLRISDVLGKRHISVRLHKDIVIEEASAAAALEIMSRFSADPRWLIYLPPTMSPCGTSELDGYLEHPAEAFAYYRKSGVSRVVCEQKHMGSRAIIILCRTTDAATSRFGIRTGNGGIIYTRTGRHFFDDAAKEEALLARLRAALDASGFWDDNHTDWVCLDTELMPWSAKAQQLLLEQYAPAGVAGKLGLDAAMDALAKTLAENPPPVTSAQAAPQMAPDAPKTADLSALFAALTERAACIVRYTDAYRRYCWQVNSIDDYRIAPFHILATEGKVWADVNHLEHLGLIKKYITGTDPLFIATNHLALDLEDESSVAAGADWWSALTESGGEGMVVKPLDFTLFHNNRIVQPAVKCRGREYLRIIYGADYTTPEHLSRLRSRSLVKKRRLALAEFALGIEGLERFVRRDGLYHVHECAAGVLALENETVDPRL